MNKIILVAIFSTVVSFARFDAVAMQQCEAYNNMHHTKNTHHVLLSVQKDYTVVKKHKGQYLVLIPNENIAQRWVDPNCFLKSKRSHKKPYITMHTKKYESSIFHNKNSKNQSLLVLSWQNAFCQTHQRYAECKNEKIGDVGHLTLHGLWPQPRNKQYCHVSKKIISKDKFHQWRRLPNIDIEPKTLELMDHYMPGYISMLHKHEWIRHGTCYGENANQYFHDGLSMTKEVDNSAVGYLLHSHIGKFVTLKQIRVAFDKSFGLGAGERVALGCRGGLITEIRIHIGNHGDELKDLILKGSKARSRCQKGKIDRSGY